MAESESKGKKVANTDEPFESVADALHLQQSVISKLVFNIFPVFFYKTFYHITTLVSNVI